MVLLTGWGYYVFAQTVVIPPILKEHCLFIGAGIDHCPEYWYTVRDLNHEYDTERRKLSTQQQLSEYLNTSLIPFYQPQARRHQIDLKGNELFIYEYKFYLLELFKAHLTKYTDIDPSAKILDDFWKKTYFYQDHSGLGIVDLKLYTQQPQQYDSSVILNVSVRNYTLNQINNIEDLYCFTTIDNRDYIYPMNITPSFWPNSITNLIVQLDVTETSLLEQISSRNIACTLVYTQFGAEKYTNWAKLSFDVTKAQ